MPQKKKSKNTSIKKIHGVVDSSVGNYEHDPFFIKKAAEMKALIDKVGLPKEFYEKK